MCKNSQAGHAAVCCTPISSLHLFIAEQSRNAGAGMMGLILNPAGENHEPQKFYPQKTCRGLESWTSCLPRKPSKQCWGWKNKKYITNNKSWAYCWLNDRTPMDFKESQMRYTSCVIHGKKKKKKKKAISVFELTPKRQSVMVDNSLILFQC